MKLVEVVIKPLSAFGTPLKGDTIFGHICWQIVYDETLIKESFSKLLEEYCSAPFLVVSSAFPVIEGDDGRFWLFKRPLIPLYYFDEEEGNCIERLKKRKEKRKKIWIRSSSLEIDLSSELLSSNELSKRYGVVVKTEKNFHNSINRITFTTGEGFAPFFTENTWFSSKTKLSIFVAYKEETITKESIKTIFQRIGVMGFGRDATWGMGRFKVEEVIEQKLPANSRFLYALSPFVPEKESYKRIWFQPFVRFGKHGSYLVFSGNPFKEPILFADEGAVIESVEAKGPIIGTAISNISKAEPRTIAQGYTIAIPLIWEASNGNL